MEENYDLDGSPTFTTCPYSNESKIGQHNQLTTISIPSNSIIIAALEIIASKWDFFFGK